jgi:hypothetical protein
MWVSVGGPPDNPDRKPAISCCSPGIMMWASPL